MALDIDEIEAEAQNPLLGTADGVTIRQRDLRELIAAYRLMKSRTAIRTEDGIGGVRLQKLQPPGADD